MSGTVPTELEGQTFPQRHGFQGQRYALNRNFRCATGRVPYPPVAFCQRGASPEQTYFPFVFPGTKFRVLGSATGAGVRQKT